MKKIRDISGFLNMKCGANFTNITIKIWGRDLESLYVYGFIIYHLLTSLNNRINNPIRSKIIKARKHWDGHFNFI